ncbi:hypothetical protein Ato02nite_062890 [Paractinoplanes toevensis]|uniref:Uncharacterized protein n=1 Tax=Paractinoplanes toevensis TaxID=571911 RepID=A0A919TIG1_9ACTN|nr:hypothetical protein Ato02nite_062890 [Actinoplanes toevensis]
MRLAATTARIDRPRAPPACWAVLVKPETVPVSAGAAPAMASMMIAGTVMPTPRPITISGGSMSAT